ncbi:hypothetical protein J2125_003918 [Erwinia toletana]|uniref:Uncharacterized protein n=1 Tax=Winslowiella toletana TaxID=92490 RepID=A0ABS4PF62_9GAMM|nr:hypothetical protein [Winslowiella toletana]
MKLIISLLMLVHLQVNAAFKLDAEPGDEPAAPLDTQ